MTDKFTCKVKPELLAPAGGMEQLDTAMRFGADAVYGGMQEYGLRAAASNFSFEELKEAVNKVHSLGKKFYLALNMLPFDKDINGLVNVAKLAQQARADAVIVSDIGAVLTLRQEVPDLPIHISTQANVMNSITAKHMHDIGAERIVLSREMSIEDITQMRQNLPKSVELEAFVHGAMCVSYSGRCLLSSAILGRSGNRGECAQPCRWHYMVADINRPDNWMPVIQEANTTTLFSAYDLRMIEHLPDIINAGITSLKIEGRMKSAYYVATVVYAYRKAIDTLYDKGIEAYKAILPELVNELQKASHRVSNTGFYYGQPNPPAGADGFMQSMEFLGVASNDSNGDTPTEITLKNRFFVGDKLEVLSPNGCNSFTVDKIIIEKTGESVETYSIAGTKVLLNIPFAVKTGDLLRGPTRNHEKLCR